MRADSTEQVPTSTHPKQARPPNARAKSGSGTGIGHRDQAPGSGTGIRHRDQAPGSEPRGRQPTMIDSTTAMTTVFKKRAITLWRLTVRRIAVVVTAVSVVPNVDEQAMAK